MILEDILCLMGNSSSPESDYTPIACLLNSGYGCVGYFNPSVNENLSDTIVLLNMRLVVCLNTAVLVSGKALAAGFCRRITRG